VFASIVVGTDGSDTASEAVRQAVELAARLGAQLHIVGAYEPVAEARPREEALQAPADLQWIVNPREDAAAASRRWPTRARAIRPTRSSASPRSRAPTSSSSATRA
jgi:nucleotide-binding universal stress UspA family protein